MALESILQLRCNSKLKKKFSKWCEEAGKEPTSYLREIMEAAPEGRVSIKPTKEQKKVLKEMYK